MKSNELLFLEQFINHAENVYKVQKDIKENFNIDSEYDNKLNILHLYSSNINESLNLNLAKEYIFTEIDESMINIEYGC